MAKKQEKKEQPKIEKTAKIVTTNVIEKTKLEKYKTPQPSKKRLDRIDKLLDKLERRTQAKAEKHNQSEIIDIKPNKKKRPRLKTSDIERLKQNKDLSEYEP